MLGGYWRLLQTTKLDVTEYYHKLETLRSIHPRISVFDFIGVISECKGRKVSNQKDDDEMSTKKYVQNLL